MTGIIQRKFVRKDRSEEELGERYGVSICPYSSYSESAASMDTGRTNLTRRVAVVLMF
jgi:hypothetical protein